jgi:hypothetical protein
MALPPIRFNWKHKEMKAVINKTVSHKKMAQQFFYRDFCPRITRVDATRLRDFNREAAFDQVRKGFAQGRTRSVLLDDGNTACL